MEHSLNIVLIEPEIPQNTGNIARTCAATGARLHLVGPMGFRITDKQVKRAGLDYWDKLDITYYDNTEEFFEKNKGGTFYYFSTKAEQAHSDVEYPNNCYLVFGKEKVTKHNRRRVRIITKTLELLPDKHFSGRILNVFEVNL